MTTADLEAAVRAAFDRWRSARQERDRRIVDAIRAAAARVERTARAGDVPPDRREALEQRATELRELASEAAELAGLEDDDDDDHEAGRPT